MEDHPAIGVGWVAVAGLMILVLHLKHKGYVPASLYGMVLGGLACWLVNTIAGPDSDPLQFKPEQFMFVLLPPIVLNSGLKFKWNEANGTIGTSILLAWLGTIGSALWIALGLWAKSNVEPWIVAFWIGSILSPTDPVGTLDQMKSLRDNIPVRLVLEHESLLNDAVAVILVHTSHRAWNLSQTLTKTETMEIVAVAMGLTVLSIITGATSARICIWLNRTDPIFILVVGMFVFSFCEGITASGIIALFVFGATLTHYSTAIEAAKTVEYISDFSETYVYITMGGVITQTSFDYINFGITAICAAFVGRVLNVFLFSKLAKIGGVSWSYDEILFMSVCGMRGAVSLALAVSAPSSLRTMFVTITVMEVLFSMIFTTLASGYCINYLRIFT